MECEDIRDYACDALLVWGDEKTFKHFLPRIYELFAVTPDPQLALIDAEILFSKFRHGKWRTWPADEQSAVEGLLRAIWRSVLSHDFSPDDLDYDIESWVCTIAQCEDDLSWYLDEWTSDERESSERALAVLLLSEDPRDPFWDGREEQFLQLKRWKSSTAVADKLRQALSACSDSNRRRELNSAFEVALSVPREPI
jgi:hypothetical protein